MNSDENQDRKDQSKSKDRQRPNNTKKGSENRFWNEPFQVIGEKIEELSDNIAASPEERQQNRKERQLERQKMRKLRQLDRKARRQARQEKRKARQQTRQNFRSEKQAFKEQLQSEKEQHKKQEQALREDIEEKQEELQQDVQKKRQKSWRRTKFRTKRRTNRFLKFQNRLWWRGYFTIIGWILLIALSLLGIFYLFKWMGINLIEVFQNSTTQGTLTLPDISRYIV